jgi:hypothetical protein
VANDTPAFSATSATVGLDDDMLRATLPVDIAAIPAETCDRLEFGRDDEPVHQTPAAQ